MGKETGRRTILLQGKSRGLNNRPNMSTKYKYPRTYHLPWSLGKTSDDKTLPSVDCFIDKEIVITEKRDGENTTIYNDGYHARSIDSRFHPSRSFIAQLQGKVSYLIDPAIRICGENLYAKHSIWYTHLKSYFEVFAVCVDDVILSWNETVEMSNKIGLITVPVLYKGIWKGEEHLNSVWENYQSEDEVEGYVVRLLDSFHFKYFSTSVAKYVRKNHVQTDVHWKTKWKPNLLLK